MTTTDNLFLLVSYRLPFKVQTAKSPQYELYVFLEIYRLSCSKKTLELERDELI